MTVLDVPDGPKAIREALCAAQSALGARAADRADLGTLQARLDALQRLINECDRHRPLGPDGTHGDRHTPTCGCQDVVHSPTAAAGQRHAMTNDDGELFYPDSPDDAVLFAEGHGARYVHPEGGDWS